MSAFIGKFQDYSSADVLRVIDALDTRARLREVETKILSEHPKADDLDRLAYEAEMVALQKVKAALKTIEHFVYCEGNRYSREKRGDR